MLRRINALQVNQNIGKYGKVKYYKHLPNSENLVSVICDHVQLMGYTELDQRLWFFTKEDEPKDCSPVSIEVYEEITPE
ncbi:hypothetical protein [Leptospira licerasiae]|uniref:hypothetical protein n=1 Tax=Leptospira licerasiae TaxID=447106 RepID=UPI0030171BD1